jgi:PncC family amidohydrolase
MNYFWPNNKANESTIIKTDNIPITVAVAESVTAGALSNCLCSEPGASQYFKGGIVAYSVLSKKELLGIDIEYAESHNFANPFTTSEMAKSIVKKFNARIGISTTGYSLPMYRPENKSKNECLLDIKNPYAYICLYDSQTNFEIIKKIEFTYVDNIPNHIQRATVQAKVALEGKNLFLNYINKEKVSSDTIQHDTQLNS